MIKNTSVKVVLNSDLHEKLKNFCKKNEISMSRYLSILIEKDLLKRQNVTLLK